MVRTHTGGSNLHEFSFDDPRALANLGRKSLAPLPRIPSIPRTCGLLATVMSLTVLGARAIFLDM
jgi:hypothetical protein